MSGLRIGSLFSGYEGIGMAVEQVWDAKLAWVSDIDPGACKILAHRYPDLPNHGDITKIDWNAVEPVDILTGGFPCFPAGTLVTTWAGLVPIEDVAEGDMVLTHGRRWRPVIQTMTRVTDHQVTVKAMGAPTITTTDEHPFYVRRTATGVNEWVKAADLRRGMFVAQPQDRASLAPVSSQDVATWYLIGRWLGDGWTVTHRRTSVVPQGQRGSRVNSVARRVHWCCAPEETDDLEKAFAEAGINPSRADERTVVKYVMQSVAWADKLDDFGQYAYGKRVPEYVHSLSLPLQEALLRGWLDSDGDVKADGTINGTTVSKALALGMARVARLVYDKPVSLHEVTPSATKRIERRTVNQRPYWNIRISTGEPKQAFISDGFVWVPVRSVERTATEQRVYNIGVQDDESYVADSLVVHNCQDVSHAGKRAGLRPDTRSGLWSQMAYAVSVLRPRYVIAENVRGLLSAKADSSLEPCPWCVGGSGDGEPDLRALGCVLGDLAELRYDAQWVGLRAADVGAPHGRFRVFVLATDTERGGQHGRSLNALGRPLVGVAAAGSGEGTGAAVHAAVSGLQGQAGGRVQPSLSRARRGGLGFAQDTLAADTSGQRHGRGQDRREVGRVDGGAEGEARQRERARAESGDRGAEVAADADLGRLGGDGLRDVVGRTNAGGRATPAQGRGGVDRVNATGTDERDEVAADADRLAGQRPGAAGRGCELGEPAASSPEPGSRGGRSDHRAQPVQWGVYAPAIERWQRVLGRVAPAPTETSPKGSQRLSPRFVEWLMGLPAGWVTDVPDLNRNAQLKALGNGVVSQQALAAITYMLNAERAAA